MQQIATGLGIAVASLIVRGTVALASAVEPGGSWLGYRWAFGVIAALLLLPAVEAALLPKHAGAAVAHG